MKKHLLWIYKNTKICIILLMAIATLCNQNVGVVYAQLDTGTGGGQGLDTGTGDITLDFELNNPLAGSGVNTITDFVKRLLDIVLTIGVPVIAVFIILAGSNLSLLGEILNKLKTQKIIFLV
jgi:hypothetical protein